MGYFLSALSVFFIIAAYKFFSNYYYLRRTRWLMEEYNNYLDNLKDGKQESWSFLEYIDELKKLFIRAGFKDYTRSRLKFAGYGHVQPMHSNWLDNLGCDDDDFIRITIQRFYEAKGIFKTRMSEAYNPFYWIETILKLPSNFLKYLGVSQGSILSRLADLIGWALAIFAIIISLPDFYEFRDLVSKWIKSMLN